MAQFDGKTVIVTGAARGVGRSVARRMLESGAKVMLADSDEAKLTETRDDLRGNNGNVAAFGCDISQKFGVNNLLSATLDAFDHIDVLVTTATDYERVDPLDLTADALERVMASNLRSAFMLTKIVSAKMIAQKETAKEGSSAGSIVHVSSLAGQVASPEIAAFSISCAALDQLTRSFAIALAPHGIRVNGVAPGGVMSENVRLAIKETPDLRAAMMARTPLGRIGEPKEAADAVLFLASQAASFITGQIMVVDGGRSALDPLAATNF
ncbi:MAG: SDR family oxidoreductase [Neomegalonema sp.]|nr:SDR family oxidoreductase [Neomegalonema sp.]